MIVSASRRTDLPAFYSRWFMNRVREGYALVPHPFNRNKVYRVSLDAEDVEALVFWSKNPGPIIENLPELDRRGFRYYFLYTLNHYPSVFEPKVPPLQERLAAFDEISSRLGPERVIWRYDPIVISNRTGWDFHRRNFEALADRLAGRTTRVIISPAQFYAKTRRRLAALEPQGFLFDQDASTRPECRLLLADLAETARKKDLEIMICADEGDYTELGVPPARCIDGDLIERLWQVPVPEKKDPGQRKACGCAVSKDIGISDTCLHHCPYCYATISEKAARQNNDRHQPDAPAMLGAITE